MQNRHNTNTHRISPQFVGLDSLSSMYEPMYESYVIMIITIIVAVMTITMTIMMMIIIIMTVIMIIILTIIISHPIGKIGIIGTIGRQWRKPYGKSRKTI